MAATVAEVVVVLLAAVEAVTTVARLELLVAATVSELTTATVELGG